MTYAIERLIDKAAAELGFDRLALRRQNLVRASQMPYTNAMGLEYDSGEYAANMDRILALSDWAGSASRKAAARARGKLWGVGFANYVESSIGTPKERVDVMVLADRIEVVIGTQSAGQGHETSFAQVAADLLGVPFERVFIIAGDTDRVSAGGGTHSGRSLRHASTVLSHARHALVDKAKDLLHALVGAQPSEVVFDEGVLKWPLGAQQWSWFELAALAQSSDLDPSLRSL